MQLQSANTPGIELLQNFQKEVLNAEKTQIRHYVKALSRHSDQSKKLFDYWKELREEERKTRKRYAFWILIVAGIQSILVYVWAICSWFHIENTTFLELFGLVTLVCSQTFGLVFVVVKYFFGQKPEGLTEITKFISKTHPVSPFSSVSGRKSRD